MFEALQIVEAPEACNSATQLSHATQAPKGGINSAINSAIKLNRRTQTRALTPLVASLRSMF